MYNGFAVQLLDIEVQMPCSFQKQLTKVQSKMPLVVKARDHDLCRAAVLMEMGAQRHWLHYHRPQ